MRFRIAVTLVSHRVPATRCQRAMRRTLFDGEHSRLRFVCAASVINGITTLTDSGYLCAGITGAFPPGTPIAKILPAG